MSLNLPLPLDADSVKVAEALLCARRWRAVLLQEAEGQGPRYDGAGFMCVSIFIDWLASRCCGGGGDRC